ncbi:MAG: glycoside hydrolase family 92 protein [Alphaproteobacteria bacterium]|nr:glycoside hydrolase family 92 protein [Alphaproteobacteria bacterium]
MTVLLLLLACAAGSSDEPADLLSLVDPFVGTGGLGFGYGGLTPAAQQPSGLAKVGPDTRIASSAAPFSHTAGYYYEDDLIQAFSHARLPGIGVTDGGLIGFMPSDVATSDPTVYRRGFSHDEEEASPGYYKVRVEDVAVVEIAAGVSSARHRYRFFSEDEHWVNVDLGHSANPDHDVRDAWLQIDPEAQELRGYVLMDGGLSGRQDRGWPMWFVARFSQPWAEQVLWQDDVASSAVNSAGLPQATGPGAAASLRFNASTEVAVGLSMVDLAGARAQLEAEAGAMTLEELVEAAETSWEDRLSRISIYGGSEDDQALFATALYNLFRIPTDITDDDGRYRGLDGELDFTTGWTYYSDFSLWDSYRTLHPLTTLAWPELAADYAHSLTDMGSKLGYLPRWPAAVVESGSMVGTPAEIVLAETWIKGVQDWPAEEAWALALPRATDPDYAYARTGLADLQELGWLPYDEHGDSVAKVLEHAIADAALAEWAEDMGQVQSAQTLRAQSALWSNVFNPETGFVQGRYRDGSWAPLEADAWGDAFAEGNAWQYTFMVPEDTEGLAEAFGGREVAIAKLTEMFELSLEYAEDIEGEAAEALMDPYYWHGNEPALASAFMFAAWGEPALTQQWVKWVRDTKYALAPEGLDGNDDGGTLSAWYALSAIGLYPLNGTACYVLTTPLFDKVVIDRPEGALTIEASGEGDYIAAARLDGTELDEAVICHNRLSGERRLKVERSEAPTDWGAW